MAACFIDSAQNYPNRYPVRAMYKMHKVNGSRGTLVGHVHQTFSYVDPGKFFGEPKYRFLDIDDNCYIQITVPENQTVALTVRQAPGYGSKTGLAVHDNRLSQAVLELRNEFVALADGDVFSGMSDVVVLRLTFVALNFSFRVDFEAVPYSRLQVERTTDRSGFIQTHSFGVSQKSVIFSTFMRPFASLVVPPGHVVMISFPVKKIYACVELLVHNALTNKTANLTYCCSQPPFSALYNASVVTVTWFLIKDCKNIDFSCCLSLFGASDVLQKATGFRMLYSFHEGRLAPAQLSNDKWNCSVPHWPDFQQHLLCNLITECQESQDEADCPYTTSQCGPGAFPAGDGCFFLASLRRDRFYKGVVMWMDGSGACGEGGGHMASLKTLARMDNVINLLSSVFSPSDTYIFGLSSPQKSLPRWYGTMLQWDDGTIEYQRDLIFGSRGKPKSIMMLDSEYTKCGFLTFEGGGPLVDMKPCNEKIQVTVVSALCERPTNVLTKPVSDFPKVSADHWNSSSTYFTCRDRHVTHTFLACDVHTSCWPRERQQCTAPLTPLPPLYACRESLESVPYSLVCDTRPDCADGSDEEFCQYPRCKLGYFSCGNSQCKPSEKLCDGWVDCLNGLDELDCHYMFGVTYLPPPSTVVVLEEEGMFSVAPINSRDSKGSRRVCPETHFQCPDNGYCLPVFLRCNGILDCPFHEDEADCASFTCPGFFRCRNSKVCLHPSHVCDGHPHCPQHDDELLCDLVCPDGCVCYGWAFHCSTRFPVSQYSELRYLDVHRTTWTLVDLKELPLMVFLNLSWCNLSSLGDVRHTYANLLTVDLSHNLLTSVHQSVLTRMPQLRELILSGNPLHSLFNDVISQFTSLLTLDLSHTPITHIDTRNLSDVIPNLRTLNLSQSGLTTLSDAGFQPLQQLRVVDLRGCPVTHFSVTVFQGLDKLEAVYADNFKMCCPALLPEGFNIRQCHAPVDELSSCEDLLGSAMYTACVFVFCFFAVVGNLTSFVYRSFFNKSKSKMGFGVLVTHLSVADLVMGVYLAIIGCTDRLYNGIYLWHDHSWRHSSTCSLAGFLSLLSSEVSSLIICLITLDRFLVLRFPFSHFHFGSTSAHVAVGMVWVLGLTLASVPLMVPHWEFYSQTGICVPLPITRNDFPGRVYSFSIIIVFNFVLFLFISLGQVVIYWSVRVNAMSAANSTKKNKELTIARRLVTLVMSNFLCWFPIGLLGLLASRGVPISRETNVGMAVFVLPLNSALNPFLYTVNVIMERRKRARDEKLKRLITSQLQMPKPLNSSVSENTTSRELV